MGPRANSPFWALTESMDTESSRVFSLKVHEVQVCGKTNSFCADDCKLCICCSLIIRQKSVRLVTTMSRPSHFESIFESNNPGGWIDAHPQIRKREYGIGGARADGSIQVDVLW